LIKIAIIGSGGHTRALIGLVKDLFDHQEIAIYDDSFKDDGETIDSIPLVGRVEDVQSYQTVILSTGDNNLRKKYFLQFGQSIINCNLYHGSCIREENAVLGQSNQFLANSYIGSEVKIKNNNIINSGVIIEHESTIGSHNHIAVGARICGRVLIGDSCLIGAGSVILDGIHICDNVTVGAGSVVIRDILEPGVYVGSPAVKIK